MEAGASIGTRTTRFMMEGVGARVIRGPEWKWGKQVNYCNRLYIQFYLTLLHDKIPYSMFL